MKLRRMVLVKEISEKTVSVFVPMRLRKGKGRAMIISVDGVDRVCNGNYNNKLIEALGKAYGWKKLLEKGKVGSLSEIAQTEGIEFKRVSRIYRLNYLAPSIVKAIVDGRQDRGLRLQDLLKGGVDAEWGRQENLYEFFRQ